MSQAGFEPVVLLGRASDERAELLVIDRRTPTPLPPEDAADVPPCIEGLLNGPQCGRATMLPTVVRLEPLPTPRGGLAMARAILTEPAFWQPEVPARYRLQARVTVAGREVASCDRWFGMRRTGIRGRSLWLEGRRFVPRAVGLGGLPATAIADLRLLAAAALIADPDAATCDRATAEGIVIIARLPVAWESGDGRMLGERLVALAGSAAVLMAVIPAAVPAHVVAAAVAVAGRSRGTLLLAREVDATVPPPFGPLAPIDCLVATLPRGALPHARWRQAPPLPVMAAWEPGSDPLPAAASRTDCDRLQALLAGWGQDAQEHPPWEWAGYLVG